MLAATCECLTKKSKATNRPQSCLSKEIITPTELQQLELQLRNQHDIK